MSLRLGRRGAYLLSTSLLYTVHGVLYLSLEPTPGLRAVLRVPLTIAPLWCWGAVWLLAAAAAAGSAFLPGPHADRWGFYALSIISSFWAMSYLATVLLGSATSAFGGGLLGCVSYASISGSVVRDVVLPVQSVAGWRDDVEGRPGLPGQHRARRG